MRVARKDMDQALIEHPFGPILRILTKSASYRTGRDLHPHTLCGEALHRRIMLIDPSQSFRVGEDRHVPSDEDVEKELLDSLRRRVVRRLNQNIAAGAECRNVAAPQPFQERRRDVRVCAWKNRQFNALASQLGVQGVDRPSDLIAGVVIQARENVRRTCDVRDSVGGEHARHGQRRGEVGSAVVQSRKHMAMQVDHGLVHRKSVVHALLRWGFHKARGTSIPGRCPWPISTLISSRPRLRMQHHDSRLHETRLRRGAGVAIARAGAKNSITVSIQSIHIWLTVLNKAYGRLSDRNRIHAGVSRCCDYSWLQPVFWLWLRHKLRVPLSM